MQFILDVTDATKLTGLQSALAQYNSMNPPKTDAKFLQWQNRARKEGRRWGCVLCRLLDKIDPGHCDRY